MSGIIDDRVVEGVVEGGSDESPWVILDLRLRSEKSVVCDAQHRAPFVLRTSTGEVSMNAARCSIDLPWREVARGPWHRIANHPLVALMSAPRVGPHVHVRLEARGCRDGDRARIETAEVQLVREGAADYRHAPPQRTQRAEALRLIPLGDRPPAPARETPRRPTALWESAALAGLLVTAIAAGILCARLELRAALASSAWALFAITGALALAPRWLGHVHVFPHATTWRSAPQPFVVNREALSGESDVSRLGALAALIFTATNGWLVVSTLFGVIGVGEMLRGADAVLAICVACACSALVAAFAYWSSSDAQAFYGALLGEAPVPGWSQLDGIVVGPTGMVVLESCVTVRVTTRGVARGSRTVQELTKAVVAPDVITIETGDGSSWQIALDQARCASARRARFSTRGRRAVDVVTQVVAGDRALVAGYLDQRSGSVAATGPDSLLVLFTPEGIDPHVVARRARLWPRCWLGLAVVAGALLTAWLGVTVATS